jgi:hypothetical protein
MPVSRIERIEGGRVIQRAEPAKRDGKFRCFFDGENKRPKRLSTLDEVADFLKTQRNSGVRMNPGNSIIRDDIFIDGVPR